MPTEIELVDPLCDWFRREYEGDNLLLIHEEPQGRGGRRPDLLVAIGALDNTSIDDVVMIPVEIENSTKGSIHDPRNGLRQLHKYSGHFKFLAIPDSLAQRASSREIERRCIKRGAGLIVVNHVSGDVRCVVPAREQVPDRSLRTYRVTLRRWLALRSSPDRYRRVSQGRIVERA